MLRVPGAPFRPGAVTRRSAVSGRLMLFPDTRVRFACEPGTTYTAFEPGRFDSRLGPRSTLSNLWRQVRGLKQV
jgi:hypothetical protein